MELDLMLVDTVEDTGIYLDKISGRFVINNATTTMTLSAIRDLIIKHKRIERLKAKQGTPVILVSPITTEVTEPGYDDDCLIHSVSWSDFHAVKVVVEKVDPYWVYAAGDSLVSAVSRYVLPDTPEVNERLEAIKARYCYLVSQFNSIEDGLARLVEDFTFYCQKEKLP